MQTSLSKALPAAILALGIIILGCTLSYAITHFKDSERVVSVKGLAEREVAADQVIWPLSVRLAANTLPSIYDQVEEAQHKIITFLTEGGVAREQITLSPVSMYDTQAQSYQNDSPFRYSTTLTITVATSQVALVRGLMERQGELIRAGIALSDEYSAQTQFIFTGLNEIKPAMIEEATKGARAAAEKFASDSGSSLGKIKRASQGQFSIMDRDQNTPHIKRVRVVTTVEYFLRD